MGHTCLPSVRPHIRLIRPWVRSILRCLHGAECTKMNRLNEKDGRRGLKERRPGKVLPTLDPGIIERGRTALIRGVGESVCEELGRARNGGKKPGSASKEKKAKDDRKFSEQTGDQKSEPSKRRRGRIG